VFNSAITEADACAVSSARKLISPTVSLLPSRAITSIVPSAAYYIRMRAADRASRTGRSTSTPRGSDLPLDLDLACANDEQPF
jgi:hypothetical protein